MTLLSGRDASDGFLGGGGIAASEVDATSEVDAAGIAASDVDAVSAVDAVSDVDAAPVVASQVAWSERFLGGSADAEQRLFRAYARAMRRVQARVRGASKLTMRGLHAKMLAGTTHARLRVERPELSGGYLRAGRSYPVTLRFSSASSRVQADGKRDLRGIALRIFTDDGACDLLLTNAEVSHVRDAAEFIAFTRAMAHGPARGALLLCLRHPWRGPQLIARALRQTRHAPRSLAAETFWSRAPFLLAGRPVRYVLRPQRDVALTVDPHEPDYLRLDLQRQLAERELGYVLYAQPYHDEESTPLEDASQPWRSRECRIASLRLERQQLPDPASAIWREIDALRFNPWNTLPTMRPLGSLNRARKHVYAASHEERLRPAPTPGSAQLEPVLLALERGFSTLNRWLPWHALPTPLGVANLIALRARFRRDNLTSLDDPCAARPLPATPADARGARSFDGSFNDLARPEVGACGARFGRNGPLAQVRLESAEVLRAPDPRRVSELLLKRERFIPAPSLNLLAVAWIQFQAHDWFRHREQPPERAPDGAAKQLARELGVYPTLRTAQATPLDRALPEAFENETSHWWDCSQLYGSSPADAARLAAEDGTLRLDGGLLPLGAQGLPVTGANQNWWIGLELLHTLFAREHNAIVAALRREQPALGSAQLFAIARLVNVAVMAKIHTVEWTPALLAHRTLRAAMRAHWQGLLPQLPASRERAGSELVHGIPGSDTDHYEVPYALTEEFVSVYRLHPLLPDRVLLQPPGTSEEGASALEFAEIAFERAPSLARAHGLATLAHSLGLGCAGAMCLHNYPEFLRQLPPKETRQSVIDLAAVDVFRDRERGVPRYNAFRAQFGLPPKRTFAELASDPASAAALAAVYRDVDEVDLLVGLLAEKPPQGFAISDTAFRVFVGMASRRLKADRFMTGDYREELYTATGLAWIAASSFKQVLMRHLPELRELLCGVDDPFVPWTRG